MKEEEEEEENKNKKKEEEEENKKDTKRKDNNRNNKKNSLWSYNINNLSTDRIGCCKHTGDLVYFYDCKNFLSPNREGAIHNSCAP